MTEPSYNTQRWSIPKRNFGDVSDIKAGLRAVPNFLGLPEQRYGKTFPFVYRGMGTVREGGKQKVKGMGWEFIFSRWDGNGREI